MQCPEWANLERQKVDKRLPRAGGVEGEIGNHVNGQELLWGGGMKKMF